MACKQTERNMFKNLIQAKVWNKVAHKSKRLFHNICYQIEIIAHLRIWNVCESFYIFNVESRSF